MRSGDEFGPLEGTLVGLSWFSTISDELPSASTTLAPRSAAAVSVVEEYHRLSWALKTPIMSMSSVGLKRVSKSGKYPIGHEEDGGI